MKPYFYSEFLSNYVKHLFTDRRSNDSDEFIDELFHYIKMNPDSCINKYGEFLESTIHATIVFNFLIHFFNEISLEHEKADYLLKLSDKLNLSKRNVNLLKDTYFGFRIMKNLYETHNLN
jgi:hypothetical protein